MEGSLVEPCPSDKDDVEPPVGKKVEEPASIKAVTLPPIVDSVVLDRKVTVGLDTGIGARSGGDGSDTVGIGVNGGGATGVGATAILSELVPPLAFPAISVTVAVTV
jgi:hypothetical protein